MRARWLVGIVALTLLGLAACSSTEGSASKASDERSRTDSISAVKSYRFSPADIEISSGTTVTWTNDDNFVHNVHLLDGSNTTKALPIGGSTTITFSQPGLIRFECSLHPAQMKGSVLVK